MPGKRIKDLTPLSGAGSANNDDVVIFDADADATKRISRSQLAEGMQGDVQVFSNKTINLGSNTLTGTTAQFNTALSDNNFATQAGSEVLTNKTINARTNTLQSSDGSRLHMFTTVAALLADTGTYTTYAAGQIVEAGGFRYQVAASGATDHHVTTAGGVKLYVLGNDFGAWGADQGLISFPSGDFVLGAGNAGPDFVAFVQSIINEGSGTAKVPAGIVPIAADITLPVATEGTRTSRGLHISGDGECSQFPFDSATDRVTGTALVFADGAQMLMPINRTATTLERMSIVGRVDGDALIKSLEPDFNAWPVIGGGMRDVMLVNDNKSAVGAETYAVSLPSVYGSVFSNVLHYGRTNDVSSDPLIAGADLYHGGGWRLTTKGGGALGSLSQLTFTGFNVAMDIGEDVANWSGGTEMDRLNLYMLQCSGNWRGVNIKRGVRNIVFEDPHFEFNRSYHIQVHGNAADVLVQGGGGGEVTRTGPSGTEYTEIGQIVCGDATSTESLWSTVEIRDFDFRSIQQAAVFLFGGSGDVIIDNCRGSNNGGFFCVFDTATEANGYPNVWIKNVNPVLGIPRGRFLPRVTRGATYSQHTPNGDYRWMARIENCGVDGTGAPYDSEIELPVDLNFGVRKWPPVSCYVNTLGPITRTITLGNAVPVGMDTTIEKRFSAGTLAIVVPSGTTLIDLDGATWTNTTRSITTVGYYTFVRLRDNVWRVLDRSRRSAGGVASVTVDANGRATITHGLGSLPANAMSELEGNTSNRVNVFAKSSLNITVQVRDAAGAAVSSGTFSVSWRAWL